MPSDVEMKIRSMASMYAELDGHGRAIDDEIAKLEAEKALVEAKKNEIRAAVEALEKAFQLSRLPSQAEPQETAVEHRTKRVWGTRGQMILAAVPSTRAEAKDKRAIWEEVQPVDPKLTLDATYMALSRLVNKGLVQKEKIGKRNIWYRREENIV